MNKVLLCVNLGSPQSLSISDVRTYLRTFLMNPHVINVPWLLRCLIVYCFILPFRPKTTAKAYASIWTDEGSPLIVNSRKLVEKLKKQSNIPIALGMVCGEPSIDGALQELAKKADGEVEQLKLWPMYPHYAMSTYQAVVDLVRERMKILGLSWPLEVLPPCFKEPAYINSIQHSLDPYILHQFDHLVISYHGLPVRHLKKTDPTRAHCMEKENCCEQESPAIATCYRAQVKFTTDALVKRLRLSSEQYTLSFQSRFGKDRWLTPDTESVLVNLAKQGQTKVLVICPSFICDCLETLEEIGIRAKQWFLEAGGEELTLVPCLNDQFVWKELVL